MRLNNSDVFVDEETNRLNGFVFYIPDHIGKKGRILVDVMEFDVILPSQLEDEFEIDFDKFRTKEDYVEIHFFEVPDLDVGQRTILERQFQIDLNSFNYFMKYTKELFYETLPLVS